MQAPFATILDRVRTVAASCRDDSSHCSSPSEQRALQEASRLIFRIANLVEVSRVDASAIAVLSAGHLRPKERPLSHDDVLHFLAEATLFREDVDGEYEGGLPVDHTTYTITVKRSGLEGLATALGLTWCNWRGSAYEALLAALAPSPPAPDRTAGETG